MLRSISWGAMPLAVRVLLFVMVAFTIALSINNGSSWLSIPPALFRIAL